MTHVPFRSVLLLLSALPLAACASGESEPLRMADAMTPTEQYAIEVREQPQVIRLRANAAGLSRAQAEAVEDLAFRWRQEGGGPLTIQTPTGGDPMAGRVTADAARDRLSALGVPRESIQLVGYDNAPDQPVAVLVGYAAYQAFGPTCGQSWENLAINRGNKTYSQFGCATTANMAAQIANPGDLLRPRPMDPADATRRSVVLGKYRSGETSSSAVDQQAKATLNSTGSGN